MTCHFLQSDNWQKYLEYLGWKCISTSKGVKIFFLKTPFGQTAKIQRPRDLSASDLEEISKISKENKAIFVKIDPGENQDIIVLRNFGYQVSKMPLSAPSTMLFDLGLSEKKLWENISRSGKYSIRRAKRDISKVKIIINPTKSELERFHHVAKYTGKIKKFFVESIDDYLQKKNIYKDNFYACVCFGPDDILMNALFFISCGDTVVSIGGGTTPQGKQGHWGHDLFWESLLYFKDAGFKVLDTNGIDDDRYYVFTRDWGGISYFMEKFGGKIVRYPMTQIIYFRPEIRVISKFLPLPF